MSTTVRTFPSATRRTIKDSIDTGIDFEYPGGTQRLFVEISTTHFSDVKSFLSSISRVSKTPTVVTQVIDFEQSHVPSEYRDVKRYSEKALLAAHEAYVADHRLDQEDVIERLIEWAKGAMKS